MRGQIVGVTVGGNYAFWRARDAHDEESSQEEYGRRHRHVPRETFAFSGLDGLDRVRG